jgi:hypothetical protein
VRILPVLGPLPAIFGLHIATYILLSLSNRPLLDTLPNKGRRRVYNELERRLTEREERLAGIKSHVPHERCPLNWEDMALVFEDVYSGRSSLPPYGVLVRPVVVRWRREEGVRVDNVVVMDPKCADRHEREVLRGDKTVEEVWGEEAVRYIDEKAEKVREIVKYRRD